MKTFAALLGTVTLLLGGCVSNPTITNPVNWEQVHSQVSDGMAQVYIVRPEAYVGSANRYLIQINNEEVGTLRTGYFIARPTRVGDVVVKASTQANILNFGLGLALMGEPELQFQAQPGGLYFVRVDVGFSGGPKLQLVDTTSGKELVNAAKEEPSIKPDK